ncbi:DUF4998 domain-containing protein [uncultured Proteiniphilum sp.]|uniref:DUF4998 domain-containing protein n=1 Tax=uncultured Proteiniphilum sp. TaxID=497637 RepID=UPI00262F923D|nr:DUF4998 domain-containing protein [uncultured Proteiniphilum sp.]
MNKHIILKNYRGKRDQSFIILAVFLFMMMVACDDMNSIHQEYYDRGEDIYTGVVDSVKVHPGYEKVLLKWEINADPRITKVVIYWNQRADSVTIDVNRTQSGRIQMNHYLENIEEGDYVFEFITRDNEGHYSMVQQAAVLIYGESYTQTLRNRNVSSITKQTDGSMLIRWDPIANREIQYTTITYTKDGITEFVRVENTDTETYLTELETGDKISVFTTYLPENAIETLNSPAREYILPKLEREINKANFSIVILTGDNTSVNGIRDLSKIWDKATGNPGILHTIENAPGFNFPHHFTFDMGVLAEISRFRIWPRTEVGAFTGHSPRYFEIWGTDELKKAHDDESYWKSDNWKNDWLLLGDHEIIKPATSADQSAAWAAGWEYNVNENIGRVRYIRLIIKNSNWQGSNCVNMGEITLWGDDL